MFRRSLQIIAKNRKNKSTTLDLSNCDLTEIPEELIDHGNLEVLILSQNKKLTDLSPLAKMVNLREVYFFSTQVSDLSPVSNLTNLQHIKCSDTLVNDLTPISSLVNLQVLNFSNTHVEDLAPIASLINLREIKFSKTQVSDLSPLSKLINIQKLYFSDTLVDDLSPLSSLVLLRELYCHATQVTDLSPIANLVLLQAVYFSNTQIFDLSPLSFLSNLDALNCCNTRVSDLSPIANLPKLHKIDCSKTKISDLSPLIPLLKKGKEVFWGKDYGDIRIEHCPLTTPPIEIVKQGNEAILQYFEELEIAKKNGSVIRLSEAKCLILGEGGSGKTSLARKLIDRASLLPGENETTKGINVHPLDWKLSDNTEFRLNIWDFGGQEIYHATHQFFLTKRSIYILVDDTRKDEKTINDPVFNYWLQIAELYGGGSPLIIVQNEKGDRSKELDLRGMQGRFRFVKDAKSTNLLTCRGLDQVEESLMYWIKQLSHIGEEQPKAWLDIRRELERMAQVEKLDHISLEEYYAVCRRFNISEFKRALFLSGYLHDFGAFLHFQEHPLLKKTLVLNNQWATDAVYKVLDCESVKRSFGYFTRDDLSIIWSEDTYIQQHEELLALMEKFELCYKLLEEKIEKWLAPQLLSVMQPEILHWEEKNNLQIRYEYEFMPKGLLSQHIVRMHRYIRQPELAWKNGVVFERAGSQALVTETWGSRKINIRASGSQSKELITLLSEDFDKMHDRLEGLKVRKMIPCNCLICNQIKEPNFYEYEDLIRRKDRGQPTIECRISYEAVPVIDLLYDVFMKLNSLSRIGAQPLKVFISYSINDRKKFLVPMTKYLRPLMRGGLIETWDDNKIAPGEHWGDRIKEEIAKADVIFLLVSANSLNTDYIWNTEMQSAMKRHEEGTARVIPIILSKCLWKAEDFDGHYIFPPAKLNPLPDKGKPIDEWTRKNDAWDEIAKAVKAILKGW